MFDFINDENGLEASSKKEQHKDNENMLKEMRYEQDFRHETNLLSRISAWLWEFH